MSSNLESALYSPYGAYELKAKYQENFLRSTLTIAGVIAAIILGFWVVSLFGDEKIVVVTPKTVKTVADLGPPPTIIKRPPEVKQVVQNLPKVGIPEPVADDEAVDEDVVLATKDELADISAPAVSESDLGNIQVAETDYIPSEDEFVPVEVTAEMVQQAQPVFPQSARSAQLEGVVWIKSLIGKDGGVKESKVMKSSGIEAFDKAALDAAPKCIFKPAIQNGKPVAMWVSYKVKFELEK